MGIGNQFYDSFEDDDPWLDPKKHNFSNPESKELREWTGLDLINWIVDWCKNNDIDYEDFNVTLLSAFNGTNLHNITEDVCFQVTPTYGRILCADIQKLSQPLFGHITSNGYFNHDSLNPLNTDYHLQIPQQRKRGRPKKQNPKKKEAKTGKLWEFLRDLLKDPKYCPSLICWENHDEGVFKFVSSDKVAKLWGTKRGNDHMNYEKLSRAMRYYYKTKVLQPVIGKRLVYRFGPSATNWRSANPNFRN